MEKEKKYTHEEREKWSGLVRERERERERKGDTNIGKEKDSERQS
jgi:hypothetical protein